MRVWRDLNEVPRDLERTVVTIGNFDGMHRGHQHVVRRALTVAGEVAVDHVVAVTFDPHPMAVLRPEHAPMMLTTVDERLRLLDAAGVADALVLAFSREMASWSPEEFIERIVVGALHARAVVVGANFRFGHRAAGDCRLLAEVGQDHDYRVEAVALDGGPQVWSSTYIRTCLLEGDVTGAAEALGRPFSVRGHVTRGDQRGRDLGFPTANVPVTDRRAAVPADGVYAGRLRVVLTGETHPAAISVGTNPTFAGDRERRVEAYVLDRDDLDLYDVEVDVEFVERLRGMVRFDGVDALVAAMRDDVTRARAILEE